MLALLLGSWSRLLFHFFRRLGAVGLFILSAADSSFLVLPFGNDLLLIALISAEPKALSRLAYVLMSAVGSVLGALLVDVPMRRAGEEGLKRFVKDRRIKKFKSRIAQNAGWSIFLATLLPPPFPFTPAIMAASALDFPRNRLLTIVFFGRLVRFSVEALLAVYFGRKLISYLNSTVVETFVYVFTAIAIVASVLSVLKWLRRNH